MRNYKPSAYLNGLPEFWVGVMTADYREQGYTVEHGKDWIRVIGLSREELCQRVNDPLGDPGKQSTRHPNSGRHQKKEKPMIEEYLLAEEEHRYLRPDDDEVRTAAPSGEKVRSPSRARKHAEWKKGLEEAIALTAKYKDVDKLSEEAWIAQSEADRVEDEAWHAHKKAMTADERGE
jgi:hypothetical protein